MTTEYNELFTITQQGAPVINDGYIVEHPAMWTLYGAIWGMLIYAIMGENN